MAFLRFLLLLVVFLANPWFLAGTPRFGPTGNAAVVLPARALREAVAVQPRTGQPPRIARIGPVERSGESARPRGARHAFVRSIVLRP